MLVTSHTVCSPWGADSVFSMDLLAGLYSVPVHEADDPRVNAAGMTDAMPSGLRPGGTTMRAFWLPSDNARGPHRPTVHLGLRKEWAPGARP